MADDYSLGDVAPPANGTPTIPLAPAPGAGDTYSLADVAPVAAPPAPTHPVEQPSGNTLSDVGNFLRTAAIHAASGLTSLMGGADPYLQAGVNMARPANTPVVQPADAGQIEDKAFSDLGPEYQPQTEAGRVAMGATSGAMSAAAMPFSGPSAFLANLARGAAAGGAGQGAADAGLPSWMGPAATALFELGARSAAGVAKVGAPGVAAAKTAITSPGTAGANAAGRVLAGVDNTGAALPAVSDADVTNAASDVQNATGALTASAAPDYQVGQQIRDDLTSRQNALTDARATAADAGYAAFRAQPPVAATQLMPFMSSPTFRSAVRAANGAVLDEGGKPLTDYWTFNEAGDPISLTNAAVPPDVLDRIRQQLGANVGAAAQGTGGAPAVATAKTLAGRFDSFLADQYPATDTYPGYAAIRAQFKANSAPLDPLNTGAPAQVLANNRPYGGAPQYTLPAERVPDTFLRGPATKTNLDQLVSAYGGDQSAAESALEQHLAGVASTAIDPLTGQLNQDAFTRAMAPYQKALNGNGGMWFNGLKNKFGTAQAAQNTLDTLTAQKNVGDSIAAGGLRGSDGHITADSFNGWLTANKDAITKAQGAPAVARLQQIGSALKTAGKSGAGATALEDAIPGVVGTLTGGADMGILGSMIGGKVTRALISPLTTRYATAFNSSIEDAVRNPAAAQALVKALPRGNYTPLQALQTFGKVVKPGLTTAPRVAATTGALSAPTSRTP